MMQFDWNSTLSHLLFEGIFFILIMWIAKPWIERFITKSAEHRFDKKLEEMRSQLRQEEQNRQTQHDKEKSELDRISAFLNDQKAERSLAIQTKKNGGSGSATWFMRNAAAPFDGCEHAPIN